jgi:uncharacterized integral membrane protein (TIGR00697 family)
MPRTRKDLVFFILGGFFLTNALLGELTGGKLFVLPEGLLKATGLLAAIKALGLSELVLSIGVIPWPVVFLTTDLVNEYFGKQAVRKLTFLAVGMIGYSFLVLFASMQVDSWALSPVKDEQYRAVFGQSQWIIVGSITAFLLSQLVDVTIFVAFKNRTGGRFLWLRATGSTVVSQIVDTFVVGYVAFVLPGILTHSPTALTLRQLLPIAAGGYLFKLLVAIAITPLIYLAHGAIDRFLENDPLRTLEQADPARRPVAEKV